MPPALGTLRNVPLATICDAFIIHRRALPASLYAVPEGSQKNGPRVHRRHPCGAIVFRAHTISSTYLEDGR